MYVTEHPSFKFSVAVNTKITIWQLTVVPFCINCYARSDRDYNKLFTLSVSLYETTLQIDFEMYSHTAHQWLLLGDQIQTFRLYWIWRAPNIFDHIIILKEYFFSLNTCILNRTQEFTMFIKCMTVFCVNIILKIPNWFESERLW